MKLLVTGGAGFIGSAFVRPALHDAEDITHGNIDYLATKKAGVILKRTMKRDLSWATGNL